MADNFLTLQTLPKAVVFDMDGLMIDSEVLVREFFLDTLRTKYARELELETYAQLIGRNRQDGQVLLREWLGADFPTEELWVTVGDVFSRHREAHGVPLKAGLLELLDFLEAHNIPKAVATSTSRAGARHCLEIGNVLHRFSSLSTGDEVTNGKPHPEIYLTAAEKLQVAPEDCLALEDSENGVLSAKAAGMITFMIPDLKQPCEDTRKIPDKIFENLTDVLTFLEKLRRESLENTRS